MAESGRTATGDLALLREALARALETVNQAEAGAAQTEDAQVRAYLLEVAKSANARVAEGWALLAKRDPALRPETKTAKEAPSAPGSEPADESAAEPKPEERELPPLAAAASPMRVLHGGEAPPGPRVGALTVGSLRKR